MSFSEEKLFFLLDPFDLYSSIRSLSQQNIISVPLLDEPYRKVLQQEAEQCIYQPDIKVIGTGDRIVQTEYSACEVFPDTSLYVQLQANLQCLVDEAIGLFPVSPFRTPLRFNSIVLQRYELGQLGITPHRDSLRAVNLICIINISGQADLYHCADRQGTHSVQIDTTPGHLVLMQAPGFRRMNGAATNSLTLESPESPEPEFIEASDRPFHYVTNVRSTRYSLGLRQYIDR
ncbi:hypothetical protein [Egbenema bharatensis]|uniref:hypothetical protein n=1 Tax=Egbenema bharatensis TaxID=3463334 RepID=UPI003A8890B4